MDSVTTALIAAGISSMLCLYTCLACGMWRAFRTSLLRTRPVDPDLQCYVCCNLMSDVTLVPCGHHGLCHQCARTLLHINRRCPLCRQEVGGLVIVRL
jgi:hypothetical protein